LSSPVNLSARQKAAILLVSLPPEVSAQIFREFGPEEVQAISMEISKLPPVSPEVRAMVVQEFLQSNESVGFRDIAMSSLATPVFDKEAEGKKTDSSRSVPLDFLKKVDPKQLLAILRKEHPQTIALVLSYLPAGQASAILKEFSPTMQTEIAQRLAELEKISPEILEEIEKVLEDKLFAAVEGEPGIQDGREALVEILNQSDHSIENKIITGFNHKSPKLADEIKSKLCEFEDLNNIDDASLQQVLRLTDIRDLVLALKGADSRLGERIYGCMSPEVANAIREDVNMLGNVSWDEIKAAQQQIRNILRGLVTLKKITFRQII